MRGKGIILSIVLAAATCAAGLHEQWARLLPSASSSSLPTEYIGIWSWTTNASGNIIADVGGVTGTIITASAIVITNVSGDVYLHGNTNGNNAYRVDFTGAQSSLFSNKPELTWSTWVRPLASTNSIRMAQTFNYVLMQSQQSANNIVLSCPTNAVYVAGAMVTSNVWDNYVFVFRELGAGNVDSLTLYKNGNMVSNNPTYNGAIMRLANDTWDIYMGVSAPKHDHDSIRIWTNALTSNQVLQLYQEGRTNDVPH